jgi:Fe-Mn family superoxide dismutase
MRYAVLLLAVMAISCQKKKLTEVVEVPLPSETEKFTVGNPDDVKAHPGAFSVQPLGYEYDALSPHIDARTLDIHYSKHYLTYTNNLNRALEATELGKLPIEEILKKMDMNNAALRNNAGGYYNHNLYWASMGPNKSDAPGEALLSAITTDFGSFEDFKTMFMDAAERQFGSGWAWLVVDKFGKLQITSTPNQDNPLMPQATVPGTPILALDVWEHAYYLEHQYKRRKYIEAFFKVIDWDKVAQRYSDALPSKK